MDKCWKLMSQVSQHQQAPKPSVKELWRWVRQLVNDVFALSQRNLETEQPKATEGEYHQTYPLSKMQSNFQGEQLNPGANLRIA